MIEYIVMNIKSKLNASVSQRKNTGYEFDRKSFVASALTFLSFVVVNYYVCLATEAMRDFRAVNIIFTVLWSLFFCAVIFVLPRRLSRAVYGVWYFTLLIYGFAQFIYFKIFNKLFSFTVLSNAAEGAGYFDTLFQYLAPWQTIFFILLIALGVYTLLYIKNIVPMSVVTRICAIPALLCLLIISQLALPRVLGDKAEAAVWNSFEDPRYVYDNYTDPHKCIGYVGYYQYLSIDFYNCFIRGLKVDTEELTEQINAFFEDYPSTHTENEMTGIFEGKNAVIIMLESMDYLAISEKNTPTIYKMMNEGISFDNYYSSIFGDGATFSNEFVMNTGIYSPSNGSASYQYIKNHFNESLPNLFHSAGYSANSFHKNHGWFYNRELMHGAFGYSSYNTFYDYSDDTDTVNIDTMLTDTPELMEKLFGGLGDEDQPFMSFLITYSAHLPYDFDDELYEYARDIYPQENNVPGVSDDIIALRAKARITDDMLAKLLEAADEDTVFVCVADHFCYGLEEETLSKYKGDIWALRQRTPFFIYSKSSDMPSMQVHKLCSNSDFLPTVANLFGLAVPDHLLGSDIFDENYKGYVIFSNYSWLTDFGYWQDGEIVKEFGEYTEDEVGEMISYMYRRIKTNQNILTVDYYK